MKKLVTRKAKWKLTGQGNIDKKCKIHFRLIFPGNQHKKILFLVAEILIFLDRKSNI